MEFSYFHFLSTIMKLLTCTLALPREIRLGGIFDSKYDDQEMIFQIAVDWVNRDDTLLSNSKMLVHQVRSEEDDSFKATGKVCSLLNTGVAAIFGPESVMTAMHVQSICDALEVPHIEFRWDYRLQRDDLSLNFHPSALVLNRVYIEVVKKWGWTNFFLLYEESEGLIRLQDFLKERNKNIWNVQIYQFSNDIPYRYTFYQIRKSAKDMNLKKIRIVLDVPSKNLKTVLKQAQQVEMVTERNEYLITTLDLHTADLEDFQYSKCNITGFRLVDTESSLYEDLLSEMNSRLFSRRKRNFKFISTNVAMLYDSVILFAKALQGLDAGKRLDDFPVINCDDSVKGTDGTSIINYMKSIKIRGLTGTVQFDGQGFRSSFLLDIMQLAIDGLQKIGIIIPGQDINITRQADLDEYEDFSMRRKHYTITTILNEPFTMLKTSRDILVGNDRFEGFSIDLVEELSQMMDFSYEIRLVEDENYGSEIYEGVWNGMIGEVLSGKADMAVADVTISTSRENVLDFTMPFMSTGIGILFKKPTQKVKSLFSFLSPFSTEVWIYVMGTVLSVSCVLFLVGRLSPYEWADNNPCRTDDKILENDFNFLNSMWFTFGCLMQQGSEIAPRSSSTRTIASIWYFFTLIMVSSYTANLAAFLTVEKVVYPIENVEDLARQNKIKYGCLKTGSTKRFFEFSTIPTYKRMWKFMSTNPEVLMSTVDEGKERVNDGNYAFLMESAAIEFTVQRKCNVTRIGELLDHKGYGIATKKENRSLNIALSSAILKLQEDGVLSRMKQKWWRLKRGGGLCQEATMQSGTAQELGLSNVGGVFVVLLVGVLMAIPVAVMEFLWKYRKYRSNSIKPVGKAIMEDISFALSCGNSVGKVPNYIISRDKSRERSVLSQCTVSDFAHST